jgi:hypothetical protein
MSLGWFQKRRLLREGYLLLRGAVPAPRIAAALKVINASLGARGLPPDRLSEMRARTFCPELVRAPEILALYAETPVRRLAEATIGQVEAPVEGQIALRFPQPQSSPPVPHIDGMYAPENGVPAGTLQHFTALAGVFLSDTPVPEAGNFIVWPGSHELLAAHFRQHGPASILSGLPSLGSVQPRPLLVRAGDAVLAHYALAHTGGPNLGAHVRYAAFFRLQHRDHARAGTRPLTEPWSEWEGLQGAAGPSP